MLARLGSALILIGIVLMVIFLVTTTVGQESFLTLLAGAAVSGLGLLLRRRQPAPEDPGRFQTLRRLLGSEESTEDEE
ncbi:MAG: hypothetical protein R3191_06805 [Anaerolineales bacterium]|nr:hypothetical protein [Anaerolineales bacterium]